jgi:serine/threonine protein kinase
MSNANYRNALPHGHVLRGYVIRSVIGQGGFGITYKADDTDFNQTVAIKEFLPAELAFRDEQNTVRPSTREQQETYDWGLERFLNEARMLENFRHPNVIKVHEVFTLNNTAYMVMEYAQGKDLLSLLFKGKFRDEASLKALTLPLLDGLEHVHRAGFIHRDIKPANIYIRKEGPVLLDFGSARQAVNTQRRTMTSLVTPGFAPYEQHDNDGSRQGPWTDVYAFGATLYYAITQRAPVDAIIRSHAYLNHEDDPYEPLVKIAGREFSLNFLRAVDTALRFREADRPQSAREWADMIRGKITVTTAASPAQEAASAGKRSGKPAPKSSTKPAASRPAAPTHGLPHALKVTLAALATLLLLAALLYAVFA